MSVMPRFRRLLSGGRRRVAMSALAESGRLSPGYLVAPEGPFDHPPAEPVVLDQEALPWELRDDEQGPEDRPER